MTKLTPATVYEVVDVKERKPVDRAVFAISPQFGKAFKFSFDLSEDEKFLEKKENVIVLSVDEVRELLVDTFQAGVIASQGNYTDAPNQEEYINSLFNK